MGLRDHIASDLAAVFAQGVAIAATHANGEVNESVRVIFDNERAVTNDEMISTSRPSILIETAAAGNVDEASEFTISGTTYYVADILPDDEGVTAIDLTEDQP